MVGIFRSHFILPLAMLRFPVSSGLAGNTVPFDEHDVDEVLVPTSVYSFEVVKVIAVGPWYVLVMERRRGGFSPTVLGREVQG